MPRAAHAPGHRHPDPGSSAGDDREKSDVLIAPTIPYSACQSLSPYPGTIDIDGEVLYQFLRQILESLYRHGVRKFVVLNGHGGNVKTIERVGLDFEKKGCILAMLNWWLMAWDMDPAWKGGHGGGTCCRPAQIILLTSWKSSKRCSSAEKEKEWTRRQRLR